LLFQLHGRVVVANREELPALAEALRDGSDATMRLAA